MWWNIPLTSTVRRQRQRELCELKATARAMQRASVSKRRLHKKQFEQQQLKPHCVEEDKHPEKSPTIRGGCCWWEQPWHCQRRGLSQLRSSETSDPFLPWSSRGTERNVQLQHSGFLTEGTSSRELKLKRELTGWLNLCHSSAKAGGFSWCSD